MNYEQKYFAEIFYNSIIDAYENGLISNAEDFISYITNREDISNYYVLTLSIIADTIEDVYYDMTDVYNSNKINLALGIDLDNIGDIVGCPRPTATHSGVMVTFSLPHKTSTTRTIEKGVSLTSKSGVVFETVEDGIIPIDGTSVDIYAESKATGTQTRILSNTLTTISGGLDMTDFGGTTVTNAEASSGGKDEYNDEEYRLLLMDWVANNIKGSKEAYERYFADFDGLDSYKLIPNWDGSGTLKIVLEPGHPYQLQLAYEDITQNVCQLSDDITMFSPVRVPIKIYASCNVDIDEVNPYSSSEKEEIKSRIIDAIKTYIDGDVFYYTGLGIGEDFIPYKLGVFLSQQVPELKNVSFYDINSNGDYVVAQPVTITDEELGYSEEINIYMEDGNTEYSLEEIFK